MDRVYVIAEIGINHNGDVKLAKELIDLAHDSGCDAVKFQKRDIDSVYSKEELDTPRESPFGTTTRQQKEGIELSIEEYKELESYTKSVGLDFIVSCWDMVSLELVEEHLDVKYHKVASAMATDRGFLEALNNSGRPVILSVGMCTQEEVDAAVDILDNVEYVLACTSTYPTKSNELNLRYVDTLQNKYPNYKIGFSNHYNGADAMVGAVALGAVCVEFHITVDRTMYGSDQPASIEEVGHVTSAIRNMEKMLGDGIKVVYDSEKPIADKLRKVNNVI